MGQRKLSESDIGAIVQAYSVGLERAEDLAERYGVSSRQIRRVLNRAGIRPKERKDYATFERQCRVCGALVLVRRCRLRRMQLGPFCSRACYYTAISSPAYRRSPYHSAQARRIVRQHFPLETQHIVHHLDGDATNNALPNLVVLASQSDHIRLHRLGDKARVVPLWSGAGIEP